MYSKKQEISGHSAAIYSCVVHGNFIYSASGDKFVARWKIDEGIQDQFAIRFEQAVYAIELIDDQYLIAGLSNGDFHVIDLNKREEFKFFQQHTVAIFEIKYNRYKKQLYVTDADGNLSVWSKDFQLDLYLPLNCGKIRKIAIEKEGEFIALACQDGSFRILETNFFNELHTVQAHNLGCTSVLFDPNDPSVLLTGGKDAHLKKWNWRTEECLQSIPAHNFAIYDIVAQCVSDAAFVTASRDKNIKVWRNDLTIIERLDARQGGHKHSVNRVVSLDDRSFLSCSDDKKMIIWHVPL